MEKELNSINFENLDNDIDTLLSNLSDANELYKQIENTLEELNNLDTVINKNMHEFTEENSRMYENLKTDLEYINHKAEENIKIRINGIIENIKSDNHLVQELIIEQHNNSLTKISESIIDSKLLVSRDLNNVKSEVIDFVSSANIKSLLKLEELIKISNLINSKNQDTIQLIESGNKILLVIHELIGQHNESYLKKLSEFDKNITSLKEEVNLIFNNQQRSNERISEELNSIHTTQEKIFVDLNNIWTTQNEIVENMYNNNNAIMHKFESLEFENSSFKEQLRISMDSIEQNNIDRQMKLVKKVNYVSICVFVILLWLLVTGA